MGWSARDTLILRRTVSADGRSRAFINDQPCGLALMKAVAELLVETHGQFETGALLSPENTTARTLDRVLAVSRARYLTCVAPGPRGSRRETPAR